VAKFKKSGKRIAKKAVRRAYPKKKAAPKKKAVRHRSVVVIKEKPNFVIRIAVNIVNMEAVVNNARYLYDNVLWLMFSDGHQQIVDFSPFLDAVSTPSYMKDYKSEIKFSKFKIEDGNVVWGKDWDLIFPIEELYRGQISIPKQTT